MMRVIFYLTILIDVTLNVTIAVSRATRFHANCQGHSCQIYGRYDVSAIKPP